MAATMATASTIVGLGTSTLSSSSSPSRVCSLKQTSLSLGLLKSPVAARNPLRQAQASGGKFTCFERDWLRTDLKVIGFGLIGWLAPSSVPAISGDSLTGLFFQSIGTELAHFPTSPALPSSFCNIKSRHQTDFGVLHASAAESTSPDDAERWLLEPVGDGDSSHIGFKVLMPNAFEIASSVVTVGRVPNKADIVIPVATVSAQHARIEKKGGDLFVTDLDSTNGTFIDEKRLSPGVSATVSPGKYITFGDTNLAIFRVSKIESTKHSGESGEPKVEGPNNISDSIG